MIVRREKKNNNNKINSNENTREKAGKNVILNCLFLQGSKLEKDLVCACSHIRK